MVRIIKIQTYKTKLGELIFGAFEGKLCLLDYADRKDRNRIDNRLRKFFNAEFIIDTAPVIEKAKQQLDEYLSGTRQEFDVPIIVAGTLFQNQVWSSLKSISYGQTATYKDIAIRLGKPEAVRAVANAIGSNCINLIIPCHRVVGSNRKLTGYAGGLDTKRLLLEIEQSAQLR